MSPIVVGTTFKCGEGTPMLIRGDAIENLGRFVVSWRPTVVGTRVGFRYLPRLVRGDMGSAI